jgi:hypothetical protein
MFKFAHTKFFCLPPVNNKFNLTDSTMIFQSGSLEGIRLVETGIVPGVMTALRKN